MPRRVLNSRKRQLYTLFTLPTLAVQASFSLIERHTEGDGTMMLRQVLRTVELAFQASLS